MLIQSITETKSAEWFSHGFGRWVWAQERRYCRRMAEDAFGFYALQMGHQKHPVLRRSPVRNYAVIGIGGGCTIVADWTALPFADESVDFVLLAHALESSTMPHAVLRESVRILRPQGKLLLIGFNPWSLLGARMATMPWRSRWISLGRVKDWLSLLNMSVSEGRFAVFMPPLARRTLRRWRWLEKAGRRWWPLGGGVYFISARKTMPGFRLVGRLRHRLPMWATPAEAKR